MTTIFHSIDLKALTSSVKLNNRLLPKKLAIAPEVETGKNLKESIRGSFPRRNIVLGESIRPKTRLGMETGLFHRVGETTPVLTVPRGESFHDLEITSGLDGIVLTDSIMGTPIAAVIRSSKHSFKIYSIQSSFPSQEPVNLLNQHFYPYAVVKRVDNVLQVILADEDEPKYTIHRIQDVKSRNPRSAFTRVIKEEKGNVVASARYGKGKYPYVVDIGGGVDTFLMVLLAAIADTDTAT